MNQREHTVLAVLKHLWERWKVIAHKIGTFQARVILTIFYFVVLAPFAFGVKLLSDPLRLRPGIPRAWLTRAGVVGDPLELARRQF